MSKKKKYVVEILKHNIQWWVENPRVKELDEISIERIEKLITEGYSSGELYVSYGKENQKETTGWWYLINWQSIALELYNSLQQNVDIKNKAFLNSIEGSVAKKAIDRFDENWR